MVIPHEQDRNNKLQNVNVLSGSTKELLNSDD